MKILKKPSKRGWGYIIPTLFLIAGAIFLFYKSNGGISPISGLLGGGYKSAGYFHGGKMTKGLDVRSIRWSDKHNGYERVVLDVYIWHGVFDNTPYQKSNRVGLYQIGKEEKGSVHLDGELSGYRAFSAKLPSFSKSKFIKKMQVIPNDENSFYFTLTLKKPAIYKVFTLKNPARIVIDLK